jgi:hypothetical protein
MAYGDSSKILTAKDIAGVDKRQRFYRAVIEDHNDPTKQGRVRVRVYGMHTEDLKQVPVNTLPWAEVMTDNMFGMNTGVGTSAVPMQGTWCWVFFWNDDYNLPVIMGLILGQPGKPDSSIGFKDPKGEYPREDRLGEPDFHRLGRVEKLSETIKSDQDSKEDKADGEFDSGDIEMPRDHGSAQYPWNTVQETHTGHHFITDDTGGNERIMWYHRTGTYTHWRKDGSVQEKVVKGKRVTITKELEDHIQDYKQMVVENYEKRHVKKYRETMINEDDKLTIGKNHLRKIKLNDEKDVGVKGIHKFGSTYTVKASKIFLN